MLLSDLVRWTSVTLSARRKKLVSFPLFDDQNSFPKQTGKADLIEKVYLYLYDFSLITESGNCSIINKFAFSAPLLFCYALSAIQ